MFALIITIISIALVAALALATIYYGGTAFNRGTAEAKASQLINEGQQINGAVALAQADIDRDGVTTVVDAAYLVSGNYLSQMPADWFLGDLAGADTLGTGNKAKFALHTTNTVSASALEQIYKKTGLPGSVINGKVDVTEINTSDLTVQPEELSVYGIAGAYDKFDTYPSGMQNGSNIFYKL